MERNKFRPIIKHTFILLRTAVSGPFYLLLTTNGRTILMTISFRWFLISLVRICICVKTCPLYLHYLLCNYLMHICFQIVRNFIQNVYHSKWNFYFYTIWYCSIFPRSTWYLFYLNLTLKWKINSSQSLCASNFIVSSLLLLLLNWNSLNHREKHNSSSNLS